MRSARRVLLRTLAIVAFTGMTIGGSARLSLADGGLDTGAGGLGNQGNTETIEHGTGSGAGGSVDTVPSYDSSPGIDNSTGYGSYDSGSGINNGTGYGTGGSTGTDTGTGGSWGSGTGGSTNYGNENANADEGTVSDMPGSTVGGVFYPDSSDALGTSGNNYWR